LRGGCNPIHRMIRYFDYRHLESSNTDRSVRHAPAESSQHFAALRPPGKPEKFYIPSFGGRQILWYSPPELRECTVR
jgi:hypothetical protein